MTCAGGGTGPVYLGHQPITVVSGHARDGSLVWRGS
jgi:hypothetical protein